MSVKNIRSDGRVTICRVLEDDAGAADLEAPELFLFTPIVEGGDQDYNTLGEGNVVK